MLAALQGQQAGVVDVGVVLLQFFQVAAGAEQEHAAVPVVAAGGDELAGAGFVGLLDEALHPADAFRQLRIGARADVAVAGLGAAGGNAEEHHLALFGGVGGQRQGLLEGALVLDHVVGGKDQQQFVAAFGDQFHRGDGHRRRRVAAEGFEEDRLARQVLCLQLFLDDEAVLLVAHQQRRLHAVEGQALDGLLEQGVVAGEGEELLGVLLAGKRPESRAAATGKDYWDHVVSP
ncbi:hypothetical protein PAERUG_P48_London_17_VIM_2_01_13_06314 [Pseudomonas aeruginosa]|nr:hypothetical protein PAERUG_P48_London_17_VIM_2_01_13_06314 [Pseudomonas aeruginosa]